MEGELEPRAYARDPSMLRISDADRHRVADILREAAGEGRIDLAELDERLETTYAARTYADLVPITADLPVPDPAAVPQPTQRPTQQSQASSLVPATRYDSSVAILGGVSRKGVWEVGATHTAFALMAGIDLDLREARFTAAETVIHAHAIWAGIDIHVNEFTHVVVEGVGIMGGFDHARDKVEPQLGRHSPVVRVKGFALMAGVSVQRKPMPGPGRLRRMLGH